MVLMLACFPLSSFKQWALVFLLRTQGLFLHSLLSAVVFPLLYVLLSLNEFVNLFTCLENYVLIFVVLLGFVVEVASPFAHLVSTFVFSVSIWPRGCSVGTLLIRKNSEPLLPRPLKLLLKSIQWPILENVRRCTKIYESVNMWWMYTPQRVPLYSRVMLGQYNPRGWELCTRETVGSRAQGLFKTRRLQRT